jgi:two-component system sensor histidine kinase UhpB
VRRRDHRGGASILWRVFTVNAVVFGAAVLTLVLSPATVHTPVRTTELIVLVGGLLLTLLVDLALLALVLSPVRELARLIGNIDPMRPGQRARVSKSQWAGSEVSVLAGALNTMLDRLETERRESARRALAAQEAERSRVARELHDEVGQTLTAVALQVERAAAGGATQPVLADITAAIHSSLDDVRRIARELRPEALDDLGLTDALIALCLRVERQGSIRVLRELEGKLPPLGREVELVVYRVAQEALTNALRHAEASQVCVALRSQGETILLSVEDDGRGMAGAPEQGSGLMGMRERAILIQGTLRVQAGPSGGVRVELSVPVLELQR